MSNLPTAESVYNDFYFNYKGDENCILVAMRSFAKLHVKAAQEAWFEKIKLEGLVTDKGIAYLENVYSLNLIK